MIKSSLDTALLLVRLGLGLVFVAHGWDKLSDMEGTIQFFASLDLSVFWAYAIAIIELVGGLSMLLGVFTGWSGIFLALTMIGAIVMVKITKGFIGGYEFDLMLFLSAIAISLAGPGMYTITRLWKKA